MNSKKIVFIAFMISFISLIISVALFWNMAIFADEYGLSPSEVTGGEFWLYMDWFRLLLLCLLSVILCIHLFQKRKDL